MLGSVYHMSLKLLKIDVFCVKTSRFCHLLCNIIIDIITLSYLICKPLAGMPTMMIFFNPTDFHGRFPVYDCGCQNSEK